MTSDRRRDRPARRAASYRPRALGRVDPRRRQRASRRRRRRRSGDELRRRHRPRRSPGPRPTAPSPTQRRRPGDPPPRRRRPTAPPRRRRSTPAACPVDALDAADGPVEITFWHGMTRQRGRARSHRPTRTTRARPASRRAAEPGRLQETIDKYFQSSQDGRPDMVMMPEYTVQRDGRLRLGDPDRQRASRPRLRHHARSSRRRLANYEDGGRAVVDAVQRVGPGAVLQPGRCSRRPGSTPTSRRRRSTSSGALAGDRRSGAGDIRRGRSTLASTPAAGGSSSSGSPTRRALRRQRQRALGSGDAGARHGPAGVSC